MVVFIGTALALGDLDDPLSATPLPSLTSSPAAPTGIVESALPSGGTGLSGGDSGTGDPTASSSPSPTGTDPGVSVSSEGDGGGSSPTSDGASAPLPTYSGGRYVKSTSSPTGGTSADGSADAPGVAAGVPGAANPSGLMDGLPDLNGESDNDSAGAPDGDLPTASVPAPGIFVGVLALAGAAVLAHRRLAP